MSEVDADLVERTRDGSREAFSCLLTRHAPAARAARGLGDPSQTTIGAVEIVDHILEHWPSELD